MSGPRSSPSVCSPRELLSLLGDEHVQTVLSEASERPVSASELSDICGTSPPTIYRRLEKMVEYDLLTEKQQIGTDGNHYKTYRTTVSDLSIALEDGDFEVDINHREDAPDRFMTLWDNIRGDDS